MVYGGGTDAYLNPPASTPQFASTGYNMPDVSSSGVILPGASSIPIFGPQTAPLTAGASQPQTAYVPGGGFTLGPTGVSSGLYTAQQATALMAGVPVSSLPAPSAPGSLSNYLPYIVLGGGALILVAALSKRR